MQPKLQEARHMKWVSVPATGWSSTRKEGPTTVADFLSRPPFDVISKAPLLLFLPLYWTSGTLRRSTRRDVERRLGGDDPTADGRWLQPARRLTLQRRQSMSGKERRLAVLHDTRVWWNFGLDQTMAHLERHSYWPRIEADVQRWWVVCALCSTSKPSNRKLGLSQPNTFLAMGKA